MQGYKDLSVKGTSHRKNRRTATALWAKARRLAHKGMLIAFYLPILIVCGFVSKTSSIWVKVILFITIAYIIAPFDVVPNATPFVGYSDDIIARTTAIRALKKCITPEATTKARKWFVQRKRRSISVAKKTTRMGNHTLTSGIKA